MMILKQQRRQRRHDARIFMNQIAAPRLSYSDDCRSCGPQRWSHRNGGTSRIESMVKISLLLLLLLLCVRPNDLFINHQYLVSVHAFRTTSRSTSSLSSNLVPFNTTTQRQYRTINKHGVVFWSNRKRTVLWQQQQDTGITDETTVDQTSAITTSTSSSSSSSSSSSDAVANSKSGSSSNKFVVILSALGLLSACIIAAMTGLLPGYYDTIDTLHPVLQVSVLGRDIGSTILTGILGYAFVQCVTYLTVTKQYLVSRDARKIIHTLSAPLFILFWPLFTTNHASSRIFAAIVPILNGIRLYMASQSTVDMSSESALAQAVSRSGDRREALGGPFIYVCMLATCILCFWTDTPHGMIAMSTLAAGDGMADIIGRRYGSTNPWPYNTKKSIVGSLAFVVASTLTSLTLILWIQYTGSGLVTLSSQYSTTDIATNILIISSITAIVETLPWLGDDNYTVPISAAIISMLLLS